MNRAHYSPRRGDRHPWPTRPRAVHIHSPAGAKLLRRFYKAKHGSRGTAQQAAEWYARQAEKHPEHRYPLGDRRNRVLE